MIRLFTITISTLLALILMIFTFAYFQFPVVMQYILDGPKFTANAGDAKTLRVTMRDGVELETRVFFPQGEGPWPAILLRDPYGFADSMSCPLFVRYGYACVQQDTRGKGSSDGEWRPLVNERNDGLDTLNWLIAQPWQNDKIALFGSSYLGMAQWAMLDALPPEVKTAVVDVSHGDFYSLVYRNGNFVHGIVSYWALGQYGDVDDFDTLAAHRPAANNGSLYFDHELSWYKEYMAHTAKGDPYWQASGFSLARESWKGVTVPLLMMGAWNDFFLEGQFDIFSNLPTRDRSLMTVRQGPHTWMTGTGDLGVPRLKLGRFELDTQLRWLAYHLKNNTEADIETGYLLQNNIDGSVEHHMQWPQVELNMRLYLANINGAVRCDGGVLQGEVPERLTPMTYHYDPNHPVPTRGGNHLLSLAHAPIIDQQSDLCARDDVLSFGSGVFDEGLHIQGTIGLTLRVASSADDTAFTVKLQEKRSDGRVLNIRDDIVTLRYRQGEIAPVNYTAGTIVDVNLELIPVDWTMTPGSSLRLDVSSSNFPIFAAHLNSAEPGYQLGDAKIATQTVYGGLLKLPIAREQKPVM